METPPVPVAIETLLEERRWVRALARSLVRDDATADDVAQDAWVAAIAHPPADAATSRGWFAVVMRNLARARGRSESRRLRREEAVARPEAHALADVVAQAETHRRVVEEVMRLAEPYRTTVLLRWFEGLAPAEIAARTGVPAETVRTRLHRALAQLRDRLAPKDDDDRRVALVLLANSPDAAARPAATCSAGRTSGGLRWVAAAALVVVVSVAVVLALRGLRPVDGGHDAESAAAAAPPPGRAPRAAPPAVPRPRRGGALPDTAAAADESAAPAAPAAKAAAEPGILRLRIATDPAVPKSGDPFELVATFENAGPGRVKLFVPENASVGAFPSWRLTAEDGTTFVSATWIGQSMWQEGLQGSLVELGAGESWTGRASVNAFSPVDPATGHVDDWHVRVPLKPGRYVVSCSHTQGTDEVPWNEEAFRVSRRRIEGLWMGSVRADDIAVQVGACPRPTLTIDAPHEFVPGKPYRVDAVLENPGPDAAEFKGSLVCRAYTKGEGAVAELRVGDEAREGGRPSGDAPGVTNVPPGGSVRFAFDLSSAKRLTTRRLGYVVLVATIESDPKDPAIASNGIFRTVKPPPDASALGLRLAATARRTASGATLVDLVLSNAGAQALRVPRGLASPATLTFAVRSADGADITVTWGQGLLTSATIDWTIPAPGKGGAAAEFVELRAGESATRTVDLSGDEHPRFPPGDYTVAVTWCNLDGGAGADEGPPVAIGEVTSEAAAFTR
jgi:RNA polymerase sigma-70 factor (ECF subfamily)